MCGFFAVLFLRSKLCGNYSLVIWRLCHLCKGNVFVGAQMMYVKDDFFDSLSCDALDREEGRAERTKFSEQRKIDTEVSWC